jgi:hypothetical protein
MTPTDVRPFIQTGPTIAISATNSSSSTAIARRERRARV